MIKIENESLKASFFALGYRFDFKVTVYIKSLYVFNRVERPLMDTN
jgi:hypothetical protein